MPQMPRPKSEWGRWAFDAGERALGAYAGAWVSIYAGGGVIGWNASFVESLKGAAFGVLVSAAFSLAGKRGGAPDSASLLPANVDPPQNP